MKLMLDNYAPFIKICGIRCREDLDLAVRAGANAIGVIVGEQQPGRDFVAPGVGVELLRSVPQRALSVLVTLESRWRLIQELVERCGAQVVQLHGEIDLNSVRSLRSASKELLIIKAFTLNSRDDFVPCTSYAPYLDGVLLDGIKPFQGQGNQSKQGVDWEVCAQFVESYSGPVILAGGLNPANVAFAIEKVHPFGVDVNSGVKRADGFKDEEKIKQFVAQSLLAFRSVQS